MELALYCPNLGYYEQGGDQIGHRGDFFTSVSTGNLFGQLLARQFGRWLEQEPTSALQLVEAGGHDGSLAADILGSLAGSAPNLFSRVEYVLVEPSRRQQERQ